MNQVWRECRLGDVSDIRYGYTAKASADIAGPKFLRITDIQNDAVNWPTVPSCPITSEDLEKHRLEEGDIVFARTGATTGKSCRLIDAPEAVAASYLIRVRITEKGLTSAFLELFFKSAEYWTQVKAGTIGSAQGGFNASKLAELKIPVPPPEEQKRIVAILDEAFAGIETAIANTEKNLANARELFESYLNNRLAVVARSPKSQVLSSITELIVDCEHKTAPTQETGFASIRTPNIGRGTLDLKNVRRVSAEVYRQWTRRAEPKPGDLILAREAPAGNVGVVPDGEKVCLGQRTVLIRPNNSQIDSKYLAYLILHPAIQHRLLETSSGATVQHVNMRDIRALGLGDLPSLSSQSQDVEAIEFVQQEALQLETKCCNKLERLAELKQSLLQTAFSGELTADRAQEELESATA